MTDQTPLYAEFWLCVGASLIDTILLLLVCAPLLLFLYGAAYYDFNPAAPRIAGFADLLISWIFLAVAMIAFWKAHGATLGKIWARAFHNRATSYRAHQSLPNLPGLERGD